MKWVWWILGILAGLIAAIYIIGACLPEKHTAVRVARYHQTPDTIWRTITEYKDFPSWRSNVKSAEPLPPPDILAGWREVDAHGNVLPLRIIESEAPRRLAVKIADPNLPFGGTWTTDILASPPDGSTVQIREDGEIYNRFFRFMARFVFGYTATIDTYLKDLGKKFGETTVIER